MWYAEIDESGKCFHITKIPLPLSDRILETRENALGYVQSGADWVNDVNVTEIEPIQFDLVQAAVEKSHVELRQEGADALTL